MPRPAFARLRSRRAAARVAGFVLPRSIAARRAARGLALPRLALARRAGSVRRLRAPGTLTVARRFVAPWPITARRTARCLVTPWLPLARRARPVWRPVTPRPFLSRRRLRGPRTITARLETGAFPGRTRLPDPRLPLRARSCRLRLPWPIARRRRLVAPWLALARRTRSIGWLAAPRPLALPRRLVAPWTVATWRARGLVAPRRVPRPEALRRIRLLPGTIASCRTHGLVAPLGSRLRRVPRLVAIALRCRILFRPCALGTILFLESIARILVRAAGTPVAPPPLRGRRRTIAPRLTRRGRRMFLRLEIVALRFARRPQLSPREPLHGDVGVLPLQLHEGRLQLLALARAEGGRLVVDQNRPVRIAGRHPLILARRRFLVDEHRPEPGTRVAAIPCETTRQR